MRALCDRHFGVGGDGVLAILPSTDGDARMRVLNADGSEAEMCGNGIRCVAKLLYETDPALRRPALRIETGAGVLALRARRRGGPASARSTVEMGRPRLTRDEIPILPGGTTRVLREPISARGRTFHVHRGLDGQPARGDVRRRRGVAARRWPRVRARCSRRPSASRDAPTSSSPTCARAARSTWWSGSAAAASRWPAARARARRWSPPAWKNACAGRETTVHLPGGPLGITVAKDYSTVRMRGPARSVFEASIDVARLMSGN